MKRQKQLHIRRPNVGDEWLILVASPHWPAGAILQFIIHEYWYGHDCIPEFEEGCRRDGCTVLHMENREHLPSGQGRYMDDKEARALLHRKYPTNPLYDQEAAECQ